MATRTISPRFGPIDLAATLFPLRRGHQDPTTTIAGAQALRALRTTEGPATLHLRTYGARIDVEAWGPGADRHSRMPPGSWAPTTTGRASIRGTT